MKFTSVIGLVKCKCVFACFRGKEKTCPHTAIHTMEITSPDHASDFARAYCRVQ